VDGAGRIVALPESLPDAAFNRLEEMHEAAEVALALACPACDAHRMVHLDVASFLWAEIRHVSSFLCPSSHAP
jgi:hypothetical protein